MYSIFEASIVYLLRNPSDDAVRCSKNCASEQRTKDKKVSVIKDASA